MSLWSWTAALNDDASSTLHLTGHSQIRPLLITTREPSEERRPGRQTPLVLAWVPVLLPLPFLFSQQWMVIKKHTNHALVTLLACLKFHVILYNNNKFITHYVPAKLYVRFIYLGPGGMA